MPELLSFGTFQHKTTRGVRVRIVGDRDSECGFRCQNRKLEAPPACELKTVAIPTEPHGAVADFVLLRTRQEREVSREQWTATMQFVFMPVIPADLVIVNPMGIQVTYLETDRTLITETP